MIIYSEAPHIFVSNKAPSIIFTYMFGLFLQGLRGSKENYKLKYIYLFLFHI
jgi:hypothetical protein